MAQVRVIATVLCLNSNPESWHVPLIRFCFIIIQSLNIITLTLISHRLAGLASPSLIQIVLVTGRTHTL